MLLGSGSFGFKYIFLSFLKMLEIEIIAFHEGKIFSIGSIKIMKKGDVYFIPKFNSDGIHYSRHKDGKTFLTSSKLNLSEKTGQKTQLSQFKGYEILCRYSIYLQSIPNLYPEYKKRKVNGIFAFDTQDYNDTKVELDIALLTNDGNSVFFENFNLEKKYLMYIYSKTNPMIALTICS